MTPIEVVLLVGAVAAALVAVGTVVFRSGRAIVGFIKKASQFLREWHGEPARPGYARTLGVPERLSRIEAQVHPNHGSSLADQLDRLEKTAEYAVALGTENKKHLEELKASLVDATQERLTIARGSSDERPRWMDASDKGAT